VAPAELVHPLRPPPGHAESQCKSA
jgi:hypothetical protein